MNHTHILRVYRKGESAKPEHLVRITGTDADADRQLGDLWNASPAPSNPGRWRATAHRISDNVRVSCID